MGISEQLLAIQRYMKPHFKQNRVFEQFKSHTAATILQPKRNTISNILQTLGDDQKDWSKYYRLYSQSDWDATGCMNSLLELGLQLLPENSPFIPIATDLTAIRKHGKRIPKTSYQIDPLSPPFKKGLMWGQRFSHSALLISQRQHGVPTFSLPVRLELAPAVKKPKKNASQEQLDAYKVAKKKFNANTQTMRIIDELKKVCEGQGINKKILVVADGGYCNKTCFGSDIEGVEIIARCRKDSKLCYRARKGRQFYADEKFTPESIRKDISTPFQRTSAFYGGQERTIRYKDVSDLYWQRGSGKKPVRLIVIQGLPYKARKGKVNYRDPAYLLTTDLESSAEDLIQAYFDRIQIEQSHRDLKNNFGLGDGQVWSEKSISRHPQLVMISYSSLIISTLRSYGPKREDNTYMVPPKWYKKRKRPSIEDMKRKFREEIEGSVVLRLMFGLKIPWEEGVKRCSL